MVMATSTEDPISRDPWVRAISLITAYCTSVAVANEEDDDDLIDPDSGEAFFDILYDLEQPLIDATNEEEVEAARAAFQATMIALVGIVDHFIDHCDSDLNKFDLIAGMAQHHYRSLDD